MEDRFPKRKRPRLDDYDYATPGAYFITICTQGRRCLLSHIVGREQAPAGIFYFVPKAASMRESASRIFSYLDA